MFKNLFPGLSAQSKLIKDIRNDNYKNWESHFDNYNKTATRKADPVKLRSLGLEIYESILKEVLQDYSITDGEKEVLTKIKDYFQLSDTAINSIKSKYAKGALTNLSKQKLADNQLTEEEIREIGLLAKELNISEEEVKRINQRNASDLYENAVKQIVSDKMVTVEEQQTLKLLAQQLGINLREAPIDKKLREEYYFLTLLNALNQGYLPELKPPSIVTEKDEMAYWEISSNLVAARTGYVSKGSPVRIKVEKGVSYKLGSSRSTPIREEVSSNHPGIFVVTNKRVVFAASQQSFSIPFTQLHSFDTFADGIGLQKNDTELLLQFYDKQMSEVVFKVLTNAINVNT
ncbi:hypothetical protein FAM09_28275 [Niastella caeni]|uniref:Uncharacterized protein n=1 Tax=Niastella caeni TaxID=2569763 RepID=A0A4S8HDP6_9BACT|nr:hypothetical protein [Niastella caeni]THU31524.1 hypothetical protein FAM09_28275 [Niastella caeni]